MSIYNNARKVLIFENLFILFLRINRKLLLILTLTAIKVGLDFIRKICNCNNYTSYDQSSFVWVWSCMVIKAS